MPKAEELTRKQSAAMVTLLTATTLKEAAQALRVSEKTLWRWLQLPHFAKQLRMAQRAIFDQAVGELEAGSVEAVSALRRNLNCGNPFAENVAAIAILSQAHKAQEQNELRERLERLEALISELGRKRQWV
ncbi:MAG: transposase family protein [Acidobacteriota bacterium]|nr:transposase family protein [Acidobacteriota bacterium]